ncbi:hypothetical protein PLEOSDRAFT_163397 [Pleurotus ostreatus PC15]|uniref:Uncharacterized protein n=1 Tax=Pleurotus ostreatus (strain PC15) TaxID=1137138 RepID=A0A067NFA1_PLEO1|nr:hypothetical protein PLEOSDRAFT_1109604 [Pleurotus ostreatus PC15]KDQ25660.1 hypothetical protein PLEOSDRAFT_163397 [Pleurotus ostreatus PC15]
MALPLLVVQVASVLAASLLPGETIAGTSPPTSSQECTLNPETPPLDGHCDEGQRKPQLSTVPGQDVDAVPARLESPPPPPTLDSETGCDEEQPKPQLSTVPGQDVDAVPARLESPPAPPTLDSETGCDEEQPKLQLAVAPQVGDAAVLPVGFESPPAPPTLDSETGCDEGQPKLQLAVEPPQVGNAAVLPARFESHPPTLDSEADPRPLGGHCDERQPKLQLAIEPAQYIDVTLVERPNTPSLARDTDFDASSSLPNIDVIALLLANLHITPPRGGNDVGAVSSPDDHDQTYLHQMVKMVEANSVALSLAKDEFQESKKALDALKASWTSRRERKSRIVETLTNQQKTLEQDISCLRENLLSLRFQHASLAVEKESLQRERVALLADKGELTADKGELTMKVKLTTLFARKY